MLDFLKDHGQKTKHNYTKNLYVSQILPPPTMKAIPVVAEYVKLSQEHPPAIPADISKGEVIKPISIGGLEGFIDAKVFVEILKRSKQPFTPAGFYEVAENNFSLDLGLEHPLQFSKTSHQGLHQVWMTEVVNQQYVTAHDPQSKKK